MPEKITTTDDTVQVYVIRDLNSSNVTQLPKGTEIELGASGIFEGREWIEATVEGKVRFLLGAAARGHKTLLAAGKVSPLKKKPITCPRCSLISPGSALRCQCGYPLNAPTEQMREQYAYLMRQAAGLAFVGLVVAITPIAFLIVASSDSPNSPHTLFYGLIIFGVLMAGRSISRLRDLRAAKRELDA